MRWSLIWGLVVGWAVPVWALKPAPSSAVWGEYIDSLDSDRPMQIYTLGVDAGRPWGRLVEWLGAAQLLLVRGERIPEAWRGGGRFEADTVGAGFIGLGRLQWPTGPVRPFVEAGAGMLFSAGALPPGGTRWNFHQRWGWGLALRLQPTLWLGLSWRRLHLSNGKGFGHPDNPAYDGRGPTLELRRRQW